MLVKPRADLNRNHSYAKDLVFCMLMNEYTGEQVWDSVGRRGYAFDSSNTPSWGRDVGSQGVEFDANREHINGIEMNSILPSGTDGTILFGYKNTNTPGSYYYFFTAGDTYSVFSMYCSDVAVFVYIDSISISWGTSDFFNARVLGITWWNVGGTQYVSFWQDGQLNHTSSGSTTFPDSSSLLNIGGRTDSDDRYAGGIIEWFYVWDKRLTDLEVLRVSNDPYAMFEDVTIPFMYSAGGAYIPAFGGIYGKGISGGLGGRGV